MYRIINDFLEDWKYESESTLKVFKNLTQESLEQKVTPDGRSLRFLAWHLTISNSEMLSHSGLVAGQIDVSIPVPNDLLDIIKEYESSSKKIGELISQNWKDEQLSDDVDMYGEKWKKGKLLSVLITHQAHHRAQMTVLMRQAGLKVPGVYGPSKEEWTMYGMPTQN